MIVPSDGHPNANRINFAAIHFKLLLNHSEVNSIWEEFASGLAWRDNGPIYYHLSNNSSSLAVQIYTELYAGLMRIKALYIVIKLVIQRWIDWCMEHNIFLPQIRAGILIHKRIPLNLSFHVLCMESYNVYSFTGKCMKRIKTFPNIERLLTRQRFALP